MAHLTYLREQVRLFRQEPGDWKMPEAPELPGGSPIGTTLHSFGCGE